MPTVLSESNLPGLELIHRGKVRDVYALSADELLIVASDRLSAFDVVLPDPIPGKGEMLTQISNFWFGKTAHARAESSDRQTRRERAAAPAPTPRSTRSAASIAKRLKPVPIEAIARGYLIGSGWKDYQATGSLCGITPAGRACARPKNCPSRSSRRRRRPRPARTTRTSASTQVVATIGAELAEKVRDATLAIYRFAAAYAAERGILIADTKFEFGTDADGKLYVMDEMLTPDSSRFWPADEYRVGISPPSYDKQFVRDYLETLDWNKTAPGPRLPREVIEGTAAKYAEALRRLAGITLD